MIGLAASGLVQRTDPQIPSFVVTNDTTNALVATIVVTPTYDNNGVICTGNPETYDNGKSEGRSILFWEGLYTGNSTMRLYLQSINGRNDYIAWTNDNPLIGLAASSPSPEDADPTRFHRL